MRSKFFVLGGMIALFILLNFSLNLGKSLLPPLSVDKASYQAEETVVLNVSIDQSQYAAYYLMISSANNSYTYQGDFNPLMFFYPTEEGIYTIALVEKSTGAIFYSVSFNVSAKNESGSRTVMGSGNTSLLQNGSAQEALPASNLNNENTGQSISATTFISTDKKSYFVGENVIVFISIPDSTQRSLYHSFNGILKKYVGDLHYVSFIPEGIGSHLLILKDAKDVVVSEYGFEVKSFLGRRTMKILTSRGFTEEVEMSSLDEKNGIGSFGITLNKSSLKELKLKNLQFMKNNIYLNLSLGFDEGFSAKVHIQRKNVVKAFAIDSDTLNFTNGTATGFAVGNELWKCNEWVFASQQCLGTWQKIMNLIPGTEYEINLSPGDPGYAETGVASINTKKPIYHPGETADIIMVVLDSAGHLVSGADVSLLITAPDNTTIILGTGTGEIIQASRGIYEASYNNTALEGNYSLEIRATGDNVNSTMLSFFTVKPYYEFDILRNTPTTTDPWRGAFTSSIKIISYTNATSSTFFNFTEVLPGNFEITDAGGAVITTGNNQTYLSWYNLVNNSVVSYSATPPLVTPELYELGPAFVNYNDNDGNQEIFYEARPWYLAVDPYIDYLSPDADGNYATWTIAGSTPAATRWQSVDDLVGGGDDAVTYIASPNNANRNSFSFQSLSVVGVTINWVAITVRGRRSTGTGGSATLQIFYRQGGTNYNNANLQALGTSWTDYNLTGWNYTTNPATGGAWDESAINGMEWGVLRNASTSSRLAWVTQMYVRVNYDINNVAPNVTNLTKPGNNTNMTSSSIVQFNFTATDDRGFNNCTLYTNVTGSWAPNISNMNVQNNTVNNLTVTMPDGNFIWNVLCWDNITPSLSDWYTYNYTVHIDTTGPNTTVNRPVNFTNITTNSYNLNASVTDFTGVNTVTFLYRQNASDTWHPVCTNNSGSGQTYSCNWNTASLPDGKDYQILAYANDTYGTLGNNDTHINITLDRTGPNSSLNFPVNFTNITTGTYVLNATVVDLTGVSVVTFLYRPNASASWSVACTNNSATTQNYVCTWNVAAVADGNTYEVRVYANDTFGTLGGNDTHINITLDRTGPNTTINFPVNFSNISATTYVLNASVVDLTGVSVVTFLYRPNASVGWSLACTNNSGVGPVFVCTWSVGALAEGKNYQIRAYANDTFGTLGGNDTHANITLDRTGPNLTLDRPQNNTVIDIRTNGLTYMINTTVNDNLSAIDTVTFMYRMNSTDIWKLACTDTDHAAPYNCSWNLAGLNNSNYYQMLAYANDSAGNIGQNSTTHINITVYTHFINITAIVVDDTNYAIADQIDLQAGTTNSVFCNITVKDPVDYTLIQGVNATFYSLTTTYGAANSNRTHYSNSSCTLLTGSGQNANYQCAFNVWHFAINGSWNCTSYANNSYSSYNATDNTSVNQLFALNVSTSVVDYGNLAPSNASSNVTVNVSNVGNMPMNISVYGFGGNDSTAGAGLSMLCQINNISISFEKYSTNNSKDYAAKNSLSTTKQDIGLTIPSKINYGDLTINSTYWQFMVPPENHSFGQCNGSVVFVAQSP